MKIHLFEQSQFLPISRKEAWDFFSNPANLDRITPPDMAFHTVSGGGEPMFAGQIIVHRIKLAPLIWSTWVTEISSVKPGHYFVDEQRFGPYRFWHHLHRFVEKEGGVRGEDRVRYVLPLYPFGEVAGRAIRHKLGTVFSHRRTELNRLFPASPPGQIAE